MFKDYYEEIEIDDNRFINGLNIVVNKINYNKSIVQNNLYNKDVTSEYAFSRVSKEVLDEISVNNIDVATNDCNVLKFNNIKFDYLGVYLATIFKGKIVGYGLSGRIWYPNNGYMGWHTNNDNQGYKLYCSFARESDKSFFRYQHPISKEIITSWDKQGWNFRIFKIQKELLWHSVYSETDRFSIGYTLKVKTEDR